MENKISDNSIMKIRDYYNAFGLRYDLREARKLLNLDRTTPRNQVNQQLKAYYKEIEEEINRFLACSFHLLQQGGTNLSEHTQRICST